MDHIMQAVIVNESSFKVSPLILQRILDQVIRLMRKARVSNSKELQRAQVTCVFLNPAAMKKLNHRFRNKAYATDVLSFSSSEVESLGELVFCPAVLVKQAKEQKQALGHEFSYMLVHGLLHLLGYDHETSLLAEKKMFKIQEALFHELTESGIKLNCLTKVSHKSKR